MTYRNTKQRKDVYDVLKGLDRHLTADQVMEELKKNDRQVGLATVYRNLHHLHENNMIGKVLKDGVALYDGNPEPHDHLHCRMCGKIFDVPKILNEENIKAIEDEKGFSVEEYFTTFEGVCNDCKK
ncbi:MAG: transcriptional repressor [Erysipelotrichaceae bacterium]|nr:transcriptional repressor [Erysipelotrichaceae bacterium]